MYKGPAFAALFSSFCFAFFLNMYFIIHFHPKKLASFRKSRTFAGRLLSKGANYAPIVRVNRVFFGQTSGS